MHIPKGENEANVYLNVNYVRQGVERHTIKVSILKLFLSWIVEPSNIHCKVDVSTSA